MNPTDILYVFESIDEDILGNSIVEIMDKCLTNDEVKKHFIQ